MQVDRHDCKEVDIGDIQNGSTCLHLHNGEAQTWVEWHIGSMRRAQDLGAEYGGCTVAPLVPGSVCQHLESMERTRPTHLRRKSAAVIERAAQPRHGRVAPSHTCDAAFSDEELCWQASRQVGESLR